MRNVLCSATISLLIALSASAGPPAEDLYDLTWLTLPGADFIKDDGTTKSDTQNVAANGHVLGRNYIYYGEASSVGEARWVYDGSSYNRIGLFDADHTRDDGYQKTYVLGIGLVAEGSEDPTAVAAGRSVRFNGGSRDVANSSWLWNGVSNITLGLTGAEFDHADGYTNTWAWEMATNGDVAGRTTRYNGLASGNLGLAAWHYDASAATHTRLGYTGAAYTRDDGYQTSAIGRLTLSGNYVFGRSWRYSGSSSLGQHAWRYEPATGTTVAIGLVGPGYEKADGTTTMGIGQANDAGQALGDSLRYSGSTDMGKSIWLFDGATTTEIGLTGANFTRDDGYQSNQRSSLNNSGQATGYVSRYDGGSADRTGLQGWFYDGAATVAVGLGGAEHTRDDGYYWSQALQLNDAGQFVGLNKRYTGADDWGQDAWLYDDATSSITEIGLFGADYMRDDGWEQHYAQQVTGAGLVPGRSFRYEGGAAKLSEDRWVYDPVSDTTYALAFSTRSDGTFNTKNNVAVADGVIMGYYEVFNEYDASQGFNLYYWTLDDETGLPAWYDIESRIYMAAGEDLYESIGNWLSLNGDGLIVGGGLGGDGTEGGFLLTPNRGMLGDADGDGDVNGIDIDLMGDAIRLLSTDFATYDISGDGITGGADGLIDIKDLDYLVRFLVETSAVDGEGNPIFGTQYGDFNLDGEIELGDLTRMGTYYGVGDKWSEGNANRNLDLLIELGDLTILGTYYGASNGGVDAIPEPATMSLLAVGAYLPLFRRRSR